MNKEYTTVLKTYNDSLINDKSNTIHLFISLRTGTQ